MCVVVGALVHRGNRNGDEKLALPLKLFLVNVFVRDQIHRARVHELYQHVRSRRQPRLDVIVTLQNIRIGASSSIDDTVYLSRRSNIACPP